MGEREWLSFPRGTKLMSNILFKYGQPEDDLDDDEQPQPTGDTNGGGCGGSRPAEVKFIDFQSARFSSLATDLVYFIFTSVRVSGHDHTKHITSETTCYWQVYKAKSINTSMRCQCDQ